MSSCLYRRRFDLQLGWCPFQGWDHISYVKGHPLHWGGVQHVLRVGMSSMECGECVGDGKGLTSMRVWSAWSSTLPEVVESFRHTEHHRGDTGWMGSDPTCSAIPRDPSTRTSSKGTWLSKPTPNTFSEGTWILRVCSTHGGSGWQQHLGRLFGWTGRVIRVLGHRPRAETVSSGGGGAAMDPQLCVWLDG